ncbi:MAG: hypothetical protein ACPLX8_00710 [Nanopusillaceae archaeon]
MFNSIHYNKYVEFYINALNLYNSLLPFTTVTYYKVSKEHSIYDNNLFAAGNYDVIGQLSGLKFYKIHHMPVAFVDSDNMVPQWDKTDYGIRTGMDTNFVFQNVGFVPNTFDFVSLSNGTNNQDPEVYQIAQVDMTYYNDPIIFYKCYAKGSGFYLEDIELQVISEFGYIDFMNSLYSYNDYVNIKSIVANLITSASYINRSLNLNTQLRDIKL